MGAVGIDVANGIIAMVEFRTAKDFVMNQGESVPGENCGSVMVNVANASFSFPVGGKKFPDTYSGQYGHCKDVGSYVHLPGMDAIPIVETRDEVIALIKRVSQRYGDWVPTGHLTGAESCGQGREG